MENKPCPFCPDGKGTLYEKPEICGYYPRYVWVGCDKCGIAFKQIACSHHDFKLCKNIEHDKESEAKAGGLWNTRPVEDALRKELEEMKEFQAEDKRVIESLMAKLKASELVWSKEVPTTYGTHLQKCGSTKAQGYRIYGQDAWTCPSCKFCPIPEPKESK